MVTDGPDRGPFLGLATRGVHLGTASGVVAGAVDALVARGDPGVVVLLVGLYGAAGALAGLVVGAGAGLLAATDAGPLTRAAAAHGGASPAPAAGLAAPGAGAPLSSYAVAALLLLAGHGLALRQLAAFALARFHHRLLLAGLVGAGAAGLGLLALVAGFGLAAGLAPVLARLPGGRFRLALAPRLPLALYPLAWALGLGGGALGVTLFLSSLIQRPRMTPALRALNTGLWGPVITAGAVLLAHAGARLAFAGLRPGGRLARALSTGAAAVLGPALLLGALAAAGAAWQWEAVRQLDGRPFRPVGVALLSLALLPLAARARRRAPAAGRGMGGTGLALLLPLALLAAGVAAGRRDRVRKAAFAGTGLAEPLVTALQRACDLDRDGYAAILGGGDCDDLDRGTHPGAFDWPDDGKDQDCNGHQASLAPPFARPFAPVPAEVPERPNVVLITLDALRSDHVGSYGYGRPTTPNLDALAREGVRFARAWAHAPSTRYSVPAILTGRYPSLIKVGSAWWPPNVLPDNRLVGEVLKDLGYHTGAFLSYHYFNRAWGLDQGFDEYDISLQTLHSMGGDPAMTRGSSARQLADLDVTFIERAAARGGPFFLWSHFYDTHYFFERHPELPEAQFGDRELDLYDGEIRYTDHHIGRVLDAVKRAGLWDKTIVIVTSDHGEGFGEHGLPPSRRHGYHLYRNQTAVPLLVRVPGIAPRVVEEPVAHVDILPTIVNALRRPEGAEPQLVGRSLLPLMLGDAAPAPPVYQEVWYEGPTSKKAVATRRWHLIGNLVPDGTWELYDLDADPGEERDHAGEGLAIEGELKAALAATTDALALPPDFARRLKEDVARAPIASPAPLGDRLGDAVVLEGVEVRTPRVRAGDPVELALVWHLTGRVEPGWRIFTHLVGPGGRRENADHDPLENMVPLAQLEPGTWVRDRVRVTLPPGWPPGPLRVEVGLWRAPGRARAVGPHAQADAVLAATLEVTP